MRGVKRCQESTGPIKKHRYSHEFKVTAVKMANAPDVETKAVAEALNIHPFMLSRWKKEYREGKLKGLARPNLKELKAMEVSTTVIYTHLLNRAGRGVYSPVDRL